MKFRELSDDEMAEIAAVKWWHRIRVGYKDGQEVYTPGEVRHGEDGGEWPTTRFGLPEDLAGKTVLDIGAWDGFFSFEAEARGAEKVTATDVAAELGGHWGGTDGFNLAKRLLSSDVSYGGYDVDEEAWPCVPYDLVFCFGVLYHVESPLRCCRHLFTATAPGGTCLIETARDPDEVLAGFRAWTILPGKDNDPTNYWYPTMAGLRQALELVGFENFTVVHDMGDRVTVRVTRPQGGQVRGEGK